MGEETWHAARLIPTSGISGAEEQERRATSATLAVLSAVKEFGKAITSQLGAPAGTVETFVEVPFYLGEQRVYPDGLIRVSRREVLDGAGRGEDWFERDCKTTVERTRTVRAGPDVCAQIRSVSGRSRAQTLGVGLVAPCASCACEGH